MCLFETGTPGQCHCSLGVGPGERPWFCQDVPHGAGCLQYLLGVNVLQTRNSRGGIWGQVGIVLLKEASCDLCGLGFFTYLRCLHLAISNSREDAFWENRIWTMDASGARSFVEISCIFFNAYAFHSCLVLCLSLFLMQKLKNKNCFSKSTNN